MTKTYFLVENCVFTNYQTRQTNWNGSDDGSAQWSHATVPDCTNPRIDGERLRGDQVALTDSHFAYPEFNNARLNP